MIIPSIDIMNGQAVQLIGGETHALDAGDPLAIAERFSRVGPIAVIDLDAALAIVRSESRRKVVTGDTAESRQPTSDRCNFRPPHKSGGRPLWSTR